MDGGLRRARVNRPMRHARGVRARLGLIVLALLLAMGCSAKPTGVVVGHFRLPGLPASDLQRAGLNFSRGTHGPSHGDTTSVGADGSYSVTLVPGSYSVVGGLSGNPDGLAPERCAGTMHVVVTAHRTTRADFVCRARTLTTP
jgi:hypothetical protein